MEMTVKTSMGDYNITILRGAINNLNKYCNTDKKALIVTDNGVPFEYADTVSKQFRNSVIKVIPQGEKNKNFETYKSLLEVLSENEFTRNDCVVAVGGGVVGDISGFTASTYMRGIDFYNIPTTLLSQVDSSIGGKTAIDFYGYKNTVGAFYQPKAVVIDPNVLKTLSQRQLNNGLCESIKMAATSDNELFNLIKNGDAYENIETVIEESLKIKKYVVEKDEKEMGLRRVLNFGHTVGHAVETSMGLNDLLHGECVSIGMLAFSSDNVRSELISVLNKYNLPTELPLSADEILSALRHDKKADSKGVNAVFVDEIGSFRLEFIDFEKLDELVKGAY